jgi:hypothetical protein
MRTNREKQAKRKKTMETRAYIMPMSKTATITGTTGGLYRENMATRDKLLILR